VTGAEAFLLKKLAQASTALLNVLAGELLKYGDRKIRGTKLDRRLREAVLAAIAAAVDSSASEPLLDLRDHTVEILAGTPVTTDMAASIVRPTSPGEHDVEGTWVTTVEHRLAESDVDITTLPIDLGHFVRTLPKCLLEQLELAGNEPDSPLGHLVTHVQNARLQALVATVPDETVRQLETKAVRRTSAARKRQLAQFMRAVGAAAEALPYVAVRSRLGSDTASPKLSEIYMVQRLAEQPSLFTAIPHTRPSVSTWSVEQVLQANRHVLIIGPGGQGKSTLLNHICSSVGSDIRTVPVPVSAAALAANRQGWPVRLSRVVSQEVRYTVPAALFEEPPRLLDAGCCSSMRWTRSVPLAWPPTFSMTFSVS